MVGLAAGAAVPSLAAALLLSACAPTSPPPGAERQVAGGSRPDWITTPPPGDFVGTSKPFTAEADARSDALLDARRAIVEALGTRLATETVEEILTRGEAGEGLSSEVKSRAEAQALAKNLVRVSADDWHVERWEKAGEGRVETYHLAYCRVRFDRSEHERYLADLVRETAHLVEPIASAARAEEARGDVQAAVLHYARAAREAGEVSGITSLAPARRSELAALEGEARGGLERILSRLSIEIEPVEQPVRRGKAAPEGLAVRVWSQTQDGSRRPVPGALVSYGFVRGSGEVTPKAWTDAEGWARGRASSVWSDGDLAEVEARLLLIDDELPAPLALPSARFLLRTAGARLELRVAVWALSEEHDAHVVRARLVRALEENGFRVVLPESREVADFVLDVQVRSGPATPAFGDVLVCRATVTAEVTDARTRESVGASSLPDEKIQDTKGFGVTAEDAARDAISLNRVAKVYGVDAFRYLADAVGRAVE